CVCLLLAACGSSKSGDSTGTGGIGGSGSGGVGGGDGGSSGAAQSTTLFLVGDSTVAAFNDPYYYPRYGYGTQLGKYLKSSVMVQNLALSGRSSKSFIDPADSPNYAAFTSSIKAGDYLIIGFGHNDEKADPALYTNPNTGVTDPDSFKHYLYTYYIQVALAAGATPILTTPVVRRDAAGAYGGAKAHVTADVVSGGVTYAGGDYPTAIRELGAEYALTVIDNTALTKELGQQIFADSGATGTANLQAWVSDSITSVDDTHTNVYGAAYYAYLLAKALSESNSTLKDYVLSGIMPPDSSVLVKNPNWQPTAYMPPMKGTLWSTTDPWLGSVFGDVGGASKVSSELFGIAETSSEPLVVSMRAGTDTLAVGKIAAATDGIAYYFQQVPIDKDFTLSATATVTSITYNNSQVGFGLMVRDAAWTDTFGPSLISSYVAAGSLKGSNGAAAWSSFIRDMTAPTQLSGATVSSAEVVPAAGSVIPLSIAKEGSTYTSTYGSEAPQSYTIDLNAIDGEHVYAGLFVARMCQVEFSDVSLTIAE
ncbi:MAG TPA: SGNH/GDSL hydrolase family protein, partial [Polyangiaceae bacterium]|nr:SGNH/GDSL hydrolase family protein [Polyangiaceae bacterium]